MTHMAFHIDHELKAFVEGGQAVSIATADAAGRPHVSMAWGPMVTGDGRALAFFVECERANDVVADLVENPNIALTLGSPIAYRSVQFKGRCMGTRVATAEEEAWVARHREAFSSAAALVGDPPQAIANLFLSGELRRFDMTVDAAFDQTPGPNAGAPL